MKQQIQLSILVLWLVQLIFSQDLQSQMLPDNTELSFNGVFFHNNPSPYIKISSENGRFWCQYEIGQVGDEVREMKHFKFYDNNRLMYEMKQAPGADLYISNAGYCAFLDMTHYHNSELTIHFYSSAGVRLFSETVIGASLFGFSLKGNKFGVGNAQYFKLISIPEHLIESYHGGDQFDISEDETLLAIALKDKAWVYSMGKLVREFKTDFKYARKIRISSELRLVAVIDQKRLKVYSLIDGKLLFGDALKGKYSFRDLMFSKGKVLAGIQHRETGISKGILKAYDIQGQVLQERVESSKQFRTFDEKKRLQKSSREYKQIPWPFVPFERVHTVWNYYEQHMSYGLPDWSYLHQGLDIIVPMNEPTYAVEGGVVKCVLTISGNWHWRIAISQEQTADFSRGWLYAHLIPNTIQFDVGDTVQQFDYLGDIIQWHENWGHIHFVEIQDSGFVWRYDDNEWGICYNPLLSLQPNTDSIAPIIENVFDHSKFAFCANETSIYLDPDSLYGDIDIIAKITDYMGDSPWQLPAYETYFWVKKLPENSVVYPRTLGQVLNHSYNFYGSNNYAPYATVIYKRDSLLVPPLWMEKSRNYYHILTNSNGDTIIDPSEQQLAFSTANFIDGDYAIFVEARDQFGNVTVDSMTVKFKNCILGISQDQTEKLRASPLVKNYPNPFNLVTHIYYFVPKSGMVSLRIFNLLGKEICRLVDSYQTAGHYWVDFDGSDLASGMYLCQLKTVAGGKSQKIVLLR